MTDSTLPLQKLCASAIAAAQEAGRYIQGTDRSSLQHQHKDSGSSLSSQVVTEVDFQSEAIIRQHLQASLQQYDIAFVGEESCGTEINRFTQPYYWCVDPLDGTLPFVEGRAGYAVSIALLNQAGTALLGVVYDPVTATTLHAVQGQGAYCNNSPIAAEKTPSKLQDRHLQVSADRSFETSRDYAALVKTLNACADHLQLDGINIHYGSGAVKNACQVLDYPAACYIKQPKPEDGGGSIWDFAASACIVHEAGGWASNSKGRPLDLNRRDSTFMNHEGVLYASNAVIARFLIDHLS